MDKTTDQVFQVDGGWAKSRLDGYCHGIAKVSETGGKSGSLGRLGHRLVLGKEGACQGTAQAASGRRWARATACGERH
jgi:hypothetical protein